MKDHESMKNFLWEENKKLREENILLFRETLHHPYKITVTYCSPNIAATQTSSVQSPDVPSDSDSIASNDCPRA